MEQRARSDAQVAQSNHEQALATEAWQGKSGSATRRRKRGASRDSAPLSLFPETATMDDAPSSSVDRVGSVSGKSAPPAERGQNAEQVRTSLMLAQPAEQAVVDVDHLAEDTDPLLDAPSLWDLPFPPWPPSPDAPEAPNQLPPSMPVLALPVSTMEAHADGAGRDLLEFYGVVPRTRADDPEEERRFRARILMEARRGVIAVDGLYTRKADLHVGPMPKGEIIGRQRWVARKGDIRLEIALDRIQDEIETAAQREGVAIADLPTQALLVTAVDVALMMVGEWAAKIMLGLYEAANDCWRSPLFNLDVNAFLTKLGRKPEIKVDSDGVAREYHRSEARADFWNTMRALSTVSLEIVRTIRHPDGTIADDTIERPLVFLFGGTYPHKDNPEGRRRAPSHVKVALGWYTGVRQLDGRPGTDYVPAERLQPGRGHAQHHATRERLRRRLLLYAHYRLQEMRATNQMVPPAEGYVVVRLRRKTALERAGITTTNVTLQRNSLVKALEKLRAAGVIYGYGEIPRKPDDTFEIQVNCKLLMDDRGNLRDLIDLQDDLGSELATVVLGGKSGSETGASLALEKDGGVDEETETGSDLFTELVDDPAWAARLRRFVPDAEGARDGRQSRDVQMLWGFVRDALRPGLNTARRQHLDSLVPAWDPTNPRELLLLGSTSYTVRFINMALLREINELIAKLLSRFFDCARLVFVPQAVIEQVQEQTPEVR
jgi:hypothetical protein